MSNSDDAMRALNDQILDLVVEEPELEIADLQRAIMQVLKDAHLSVLAAMLDPRRRLRYTLELKRHVHRKGGQRRRIPKIILDGPTEQVAERLVEEYKISRSTAYRWIAKQRAFNTGPPRRPKASPIE
ncbi:hypothetical protein [Phyllobacterium pellucidum]|uniref:hypothetical protein n=1 Tax=Phyllobacterium pellucidum TaxID=2740464 RepID=UPI001D152172|nr:hypothetical protein [Phyllobacterium sp. T1018]UGY08596.1 hypothetical protein LLE51_011125 [Phyllobacterium sp. T1018]